MIPKMVCWSLRLEHPDGKPCEVLASFPHLAWPCQMDIVWQTSAIWSFGLQCMTGPEWIRELRGIGEEGNSLVRWMNGKKAGETLELLRALRGHVIGSEMKKLMHFQGFSGLCWHGNIEDAAFLLSRLDNWAELCPDAIWRVR